MQRKYSCREVPKSLNNATLTNDHFVQLVNPNRTKLLALCLCNRQVNISHAFQDHVQVKTECKLMHRTYWHWQPQQRLDTEVPRFGLSFSHFEMGCLPIANLGFAKNLPALKRLLPSIKDNRMMISTMLAAPFKT